MTKLFADDLKEIKKLRAAGWNYAKIGRQFGVSGLTVRVRLREPARVKKEPGLCLHCLSPKKRPQYIYCSYECVSAAQRLARADQIKQIRQFWAQGHSISEIGRRIGVSRNVVVGVAHRNNFPARRSPIIRAAA